MGLLTVDQGWAQALLVSSWAFILFLPTIQGQTIDEIIQRSLLTTRNSQSDVDNSTIRVELDMLFTREDYQIMKELDEQAEDGSDKRRRVKRKALRDNSKRWTNKVIPYFINRGFSAYDRSQFQAAVNDWNHYTCLNIRPTISSDRNYINVTGRGGCSSEVGMSGGAQSVTLGPGCRIKKIIIHELGHALGFHHEQTRPDRDNHVSILFENIESRKEFNFQKHATALINDHGVPYDYRSIMHYGQRAFSVNGRITIQTKDPRFQSIIGKSQGLSYKDIKLTNLLYDCGARCNGKTCSGDSYLAKDCKCYCLGNPIKICEEGSSGGGDGDECKDGHPQCRSWAANGECRRNPAYMLDNCKESCQSCYGSGECVDRNQYCTRWSRQGFCTRREYSAYMRDNCAKSCDLCPGPECVDRNQYCTRWSRQGFCTRREYSAYMRDNCAKSCDLCPGPGCVDRNQNCTRWSRQGFCTRREYSAYMRDNCAKSCDLCPGPDPN